MYDIFLRKHHLDFLFFMKSSLFLHRQYKTLSDNIIKSRSFKKLRYWKQEN